VFGQVIMQRVKEAIRRVWLPVIALELVAGVTAVDKVCSLVRATM
jgi:hypothetical protein